MDKDGGHKGKGVGRFEKSSSILRKAGRNYRDRKRNNWKEDDWKHVWCHRVHTGWGEFTLRERKRKNRVVQTKYNGLREDVGVKPLREDIWEKAYLRRKLVGE